jgi:hypothetical protein
MYIKSKLFDMPLCVFLHNLLNVLMQNANKLGLYIYIYIYI